MKAKVTKFTSEQPPRLSKLWKLNSSGRPEKLSSGDMRKGYGERVEVDGLQGMADLLMSLQNDQALCYGLTEKENGVVMSRALYQQEGMPADAMTRTKETMKFDDGPGVMMFDYDPSKNERTVLTHDQLWEKICRACPSMKDVGYVTFPSASSFISNRDTGEQVSGLSGQRIYVIVSNAIGIPKAGETLAKRLWCCGDGWMDISKAGSFIRRTYIDTTVWQSNRLDFAAGASCESPLFQDRGKPIIVEGRALNCVADIPDLDDDEKRMYEAAVTEAKEAKKEEAFYVRSKFAEQKGKENAGPNASQEHVRKCIENVRLAIDRGALSGEYMLTIFRNGVEERKTVYDVLQKPALYDGCETLDPLEPDYDGGRAVGKLYLLVGTPRLNSFAHGQRLYKLLKAPANIEIISGMSYDVTERTLEEMRGSKEVFEFGGKIVMVDEKGFTPLVDHSLMWWLASRCQFYRSEQSKAGQTVTKLLDPPMNVVKMIQSIGNQRGLPRLRRVVTAPTITINGNILSASGYDESTELLFQIPPDLNYHVKKDANLDDARHALITLWKPFRHFPLVSVEDRTVLLCALLSAAVRPTIDTCQAFGFDAPTQGSGKTLLAKSIAALATGKINELTPHVSSRDDEEVRKRIMSIITGGAEAVVWDNILGIFNSASLAGLLTSVNYSDRILGSTLTSIVPNSALWLFTGNNLQLAGDMPRRVFRCRIDPNISDPYSREFDFDPETYCIERRQEMIVAALTIIKAWFNEGRPRKQGRLASFEQWDELVRQPIAWLSDDRVDMITDPMEVMRHGQAVDPEQEQWAFMLSSLHEQYSDRTFTAKDVMTQFEAAQRAYNESDLYPVGDCITDILGTHGMSMRRIGNMFANRADRIVQNMSLRRVGKSKTGAEWKVILHSKSHRQESPESPEL